MCVVNPVAKLQDLPGWWNTRFQPDIYHNSYSCHMGVSLNGGTQQPLVFLLKMIILGCLGGIPIFGNTHIV